MVNPPPYPGGGGTLGVSLERAIKFGVNAVLLYVETYVHWLKLYPICISEDSFQICPMKIRHKDITVFVG